MTTDRPRDSRGRFGYAEANDALRAVLTARRAGPLPVVTKGNASAGDLLRASLGMTTEPDDDTTDDTTDSTEDRPDLSALLRRSLNLPTDKDA